MVSAILNYIIVVGPTLYCHEFINPQAPLYSRHLFLPCHLSLGVPKNGVSPLPPPQYSPLSLLYHPFLMIFLDFISFRYPLP